MFVDKIQGILMNIITRQDTGYEYEVWFPYTKNSINTIRDGTLIAVKNFASNDDAECLSILQVTSVLPMHYALGSDRTGYPGFVEEAAISAAQDWQQETPTEETTKIICKTIPSFFEIRVPSSLKPQAQSDPIIEDESNIPMIGERVRMLNNEWTQRLVNRGLFDIKSQTITLGTLLSSKEVEILALWEELVQTHFGIFAYTKAGKSNLVSTLTSKMLEKSPNVKILVFDLMSEYGALLIDALCNTGESCLVCCTRETLPGAVMKYWENPGDTTLLEAAKSIVKTTLLPKGLKPHQDSFVGPVKHLLETKKIRLYRESRKLGEIIEEVSESITGGNIGNLKPLWISFVNRLVEDHRNTNLTEDSINQAINQIDSWVQSQTSASRTQSSPAGQATLGGSAAQTGGTTGRRRELPGTLESNVTVLKSHLEAQKANLRIQDKIKSDFIITMGEIVTKIGGESSPSLFVFQSNRDEDLRHLAFSIGNVLLDRRRSSGSTSPLASFIFDEADMFIPGGNEDAGGIGQSRYIAVQLARRGRKYGLGIGIATQRIVYLDTNVLGQPHTYFISKLPRQSDRQRIQEAFGISEESLQQTLRFEKGQWLLVSDDATGMEGVPIPITVPDANLRIIEFLKNFKK